MDERIEFLECYRKWLQFSISISYLSKSNKIHFKINENNINNTNLPGSNSDASEQGGDSSGFYK